jgi:hypothetical protein
MAFSGGAGVAGALFAVMSSIALTLVIGRVAVAVSRCSILCIAIATAFALPAAVAGYHVVFALPQIGVPSLAWREVFAS